MRAIPAYTAAACALALVACNATAAVEPAPATARTTPPWVTLELGPPIAGFHMPVFVTHAGDGSGRMFVVQQDGVIRVVEKDGGVRKEPLADVHAILGRAGGEQGLLGLAFHPKFKDNGRIFIAYTDKDKNDAFAELRVDKKTQRADVSTLSVLFVVDDFASNHNCGMIGFGGDGKLYLCTGDGGAAGDPHRTAQDDGALLGKMLRLDVDTAGAKPERYMKGLRNPWRWSFDRATGDMWLGDVGQDTWEEVDVVRPKAGLNFGWSIVEGAHCFRDCGKYDPSFVTPIFEYKHSGEDGCSVTGGYVYRGRASPKLAGSYVFGDFCSGRIWTIRRDESGSQVAKALDAHVAISSFGEDEAGELWLVDYGNGVIRHISGK